MNYILIQDKKERREKNSINCCLVELGMPYYEAYTERNKVHSKRRGTIYDLYGKEDLRELVKFLYRKKMKIVHPDLGGDEEEATKTNLARDKAKKILKKYKFFMG